MVEKRAMSFRFNSDIYVLLDELVEHFSDATPFGAPSKTAVVELAIREMYDAYISKQENMPWKLAAADGIPVVDGLTGEGAEGDFDDWDEEEKKNG